MFGRPSHLLIGAIVLSSLATYSFAQSAAPDAPLDELDDSHWICSFGEASEVSLSDSVLGPDVETSIRVMAALPADDAPEAHLLTLSGLARGDDPDLAPAAARAAIRIAEGLTHHGLAARETTIHSEATDAFRALAEDPTARADLQQAAAYIVARLGELEPQEVP